MRHETLVTPNPVPGRIRTPSFYDGREAYLEGCAAFSRPYGLFVGAPGVGTVLPYLNPPDVVKMPSIQAIGVNGFHVIAGRSDTEELIQPLDIADLPEGRHKVFACLAWDKTSCGDLFEDPAPDGGSTIRGQAGRRPRVLLEVGERRLEHRDWLQVGSLDVRRTGTSSQAFLDARFHPAVVDMRAYTLHNPLVDLARRVLTVLKTVDGIPSKDAAWVEIEIQTLNNIAQWATPLAAFMQAQRCLAHLRRMEKSPLVLDGRFEGYTFDPESFCSFLAELRTVLDESTEASLYPDLLAVGDLACQRRPGCLEETTTGWTWSPPRARFVANGLVVYLPRAVPGLLPVVRYNQGESQREFWLTEPRKPQRGSALLLERLEYPVERLFLTVNSQQDFQWMRQILGDGHAIYSY